MGGQKVDKIQVFADSGVELKRVESASKGSAKPLYVSSILTRASSSFLHLAAAPRFRPISSFAVVCSRLPEIGQNCGRSWPKFGPRFS
jgi:hypothetical protein